MSRGNSLSHRSSWIGYCRLSRTTITGYKKKKLGHPSEKLSGDVPRATWRAVFFSEIIWPIIMAMVLTIAYMFVKSFPDRHGNQPSSPLVRVAVISIGPIVWNACVLVVQFTVSLYWGPTLDPKFPKFGSTMAFITHASGFIGMIGFFESLVSHCTTPPTVQHFQPSFFFRLVDFRTLGRFPRRPRSYCRGFHSASHLQDLDLGAFDP